MGEVVATNGAPSSFTFFCLTKSQLTFPTTRRRPYRVREAWREAPASGTTASQSHNTERYRTDRGMHRLRGLKSLLYRRQQSSRLLIRKAFMFSYQSQAGDRCCSITDIIRQALLKKKEERNPPPPTRRDVSAGVLSVSLERRASLKKLPGTRKEEDCPRRSSDNSL